MANQTMDPTTMMMLVSLLLPLTGIFMAVTPYLMRRTEVFAVTVPTSAQKDPYVKRLKRRYTIIMLAITALFTVVSLSFAASRSSGGMFAIMMVGILVICVGGYGLMLFYRAKMKAYKLQQHWVAEAQESVAFVSDQPIPRAISLKWNLLYLPIMILTLAVGVLGYDLMPDKLAMQVSFEGEVSRWQEKTPLIVFMPVLIQGFFGLCITFSHWSITRSKKWAEPGAPATSAWAYGMFARAQSVCLVVGGMLISAMIIAMPLAFMNAITIMQAGAFMLVATLVLCIGMMIVSVVYGQAGSRVFLRMQESDVLLADDDAHWKFGVFYYNPEDPSLFLPERFGVGWTTNFARPAVWAIMVGGLVLTLGFVVATMLLF